MSRNIADFFRRSSQTQNRNKHDPGATNKPAVWPLSQSQKSDSNIAIGSSSKAPSPSLSSNPPLSQVSHPSSSTSKRVVKDGEEVVKPSDSEEDSDDSLEDIATVLGLNSKTPVPKTTETTLNNANKSTGSPDTPVAGRRPGLRDRSSRGYEGARSRREPELPPSPKLVYSLTSLVNISNQAAASEEKLADLRSRISEFENNDQNPTKKLNQGVLATAIGGEEKDDRAKRLLQAMKRTEALEHDLVYHFFDEEPATPRPNPFPRKHFPKGSWMSILTDAQDRQEAFLSGFASSIVPYHPLPQEIILWILDELRTERREDLLHSYIKVLELSGSQTGNLLNTDRIGRSFRLMGVTQGSCVATKTLSLLRELPDSPKRPICTQLRWFIDLLRRVASELSLEATQYTIVLLLRAAVDHSIQSDGALQILLQDALAALIDAISSKLFTSVLQALITNLTTTVQPLTFRYRIVSSLPTRSQQQHLFRRHLALRFFLSSSSTSSTPSSPSSTPSSPHPLPSLTSSHMHQLLLTHLTHSPLFTITPDTDHHALAAAVSLLDAALDAGFVAALPQPSHSASRYPDTHSINHSSTTTSEDSSPTSPTSAASATRTTPLDGLDATTSAGAREFNAAVDALASRIHRLAAQIVDGGVTGMARVEAKATLERLASRLEFAVRIGGPRRRKGVFDEDDRAREVEGMRGVMKGWLEK